MLQLVINSLLLGIGLAMDAFSVSIANGVIEPRMRKGRMYQIENKTDYRSYNSMLIFGRCREYSVMRNNPVFSLLPADIPGWLFQPVYRTLAFFEKLFK